LMFWGEVWLWLILINNFTILSFQLYFFGGICFIIFFFKIWWGILLGYPTIYTKVQSNFHLKSFYLVLSYLIGIQILLGFQPGILKFTVIQ
jgi:hypothetical protein